MEIALANKCYTYYCTIAKKSDENKKLKDTIFAMMNALNRNKELAEAMEGRRKAELAQNSKAAFARAVELDGELKKMG